jgi:hypothetical protein
MGRNALILEAKLSLANWSKYEDTSDELAYQANKVANALKNLLEALDKLA